MRSKRPYKDQLSHSETKSRIAEGSGTQFDPDVVRAFLENHAAFETISERFQTSEEEYQDALSKMAYLSEELPQANS
jgi:HD-GYP domain-containing protein (c-di-GMP phosphodiesterase class II)